jgi:hypothetical protein
MRQRTEAASAWTPSATPADNNIIYLYKGAVQPSAFTATRTRRRGGASVFDEMGELQQQIYARRQKKQLLQLAALAAGAINQRR